MSKEMKVLIAGAGPVGLTAALLLGTQGLLTAPRSLIRQG